MFKITVWRISQPQTVVQEQNLNVNSVTSNQRGLCNLRVVYVGKGDAKRGD